PVDSNWTKTSLRALHPNIHIQRSPSHTSTGTLLWSHHEKMWDTPGHVLVDDGTEEGEIPISAEKLKGREGSYIWPGKDYANQRVVDFHTLNKPDEDMYDRTQVPRQPWHDVGLQIIGQPARDLCRHFIQRWNHLLRIKNHTVHMPFLLPPPEFTAKELEDKRITGTCEVQICRSVGPWSMGISHVEHSIQNAYIKAIQLSDHFVYIENQFFISSTRVEGVEIENKIGDALVSRIIKAHTEGTPWRAVIIIPLVPGYPYPIDHGDAGSVRLIMECQNRTINRGDHSIFAKLRRNGIDPDEYISFYGLRGWGKLASGALTTEAVYIHDKMMVVDDRIAIIGSANINERSQRGDRDSELACIIRDTDMIDSTMGGKPYQVGRFAHTLRIRLMREHLGIDVDALEAEDDDADLLSREPDQPKSDHESWDPDNEQAVGDDAATKKGATTGWINRISVSAKENVENVISGATQSAAIGMEKGERKVGDDVANAFDRTKGTESKDAEKSDASDASKVAAGEKKEEFAASTEVPTLEEKVMAEQRPSEESRTADELPNRSQGEEHTRDESFDDVQKDKLGHQTTQHNPKADDTRKPMGQQGAHGKDGATDDRQDIARLSPITEQSNPASPQQSKPASPHLSDSDPSEATASSRQLEKPLNPEATESSASLSSSVPASGDPRSSTTHGKDSSRHRSSTVGRNAINASLRRNLRDKNAYTLPVPAANIDPNGFSDPLVDSFYKDVWLASAVRNTQAFRKVFRCVPDDLVQTWKQYREFQTWAERHNKAPKDVVPPGDDPPHTDPEHHSGQHGAGGGGTGAGVMGQGVRDEAPPVETMHRANSLIYPTRFLEAESAGGNFLFSKDRLPPLAIYD
ncbi:phospholipase D, partial [Pseudohyphozyma bogoriensis]